MELSDVGWCRKLRGGSELRWVGGDARGTQVVPTEGGFGDSEDELPLVQSDAMLTTAEKHLPDTENVVAEACVPRKNVIADLC